uniref:Uncharacterized protein TCIL3000_11_8430 n=1 Tax=Trypanosoma congolense (strain IL3000) TaxID=1068625 RepID=G0V168_TRYCI|nr:unnamed protein product [Trypanosoma congolense IL3000]
MSINTVSLFFPFNFSLQSIRIGMNQLELFVAGSEDARYDAWRNLRRLRMLDCKIDEAFQRLRGIANVLSGGALSRNAGPGAVKGDGEPVRRKRGRPPLRKKEEVPPPVDHRQDFSPPSTLPDQTITSLRSEYRALSRCVRRYALEREEIAKELISNGEEMAGQLNTRMEEFRRILADEAGTRKI